MPSFFTFIPLFRPGRQYTYNPNKSYDADIQIINWVIETISRMNFNTPSENSANGQSSWDQLVWCRVEARAFFTFGFIEGECDDCVEGGGLVVRGCVVAGQLNRVLRATTMENGRGERVFHSPPRCSSDPAIDTTLRAADWRTFGRTDGLEWVCVWVFGVSRPVHRRSCDAAERRLLIDALLKVESRARRAAPDAAAVAARGPCVAQVA